MDFFEVHFDNRSKTT